MDGQIDEATKFNGRARVVLAAFGARFIAGVGI